jgi:hypothetical protein
MSLEAQLSRETLFVRERRWCKWPILTRLVAVYRIGGAPGLDVAFLVERQMFAQKEVFSGKGRTWAQTEPDEA